MSRPVLEICSEIEVFRPFDDDWLPLEDLITKALDHREAASAFATLLAVFSRFPDEDGAGVFWSIIHGLESFDGYEPALLDAVQITPTEMTLIMLNRMLNAEITEIDGVPLAGLLQSVAQNHTYSDTVRAAAARFAVGHAAS